MRCSPAGIVLIFAGCDATRCEGVDESTDLVDHSLWSQVDAVDDPFTDRPSDVECPPPAWVVELDPDVSLEVNTEWCNYLTVAQPSLSEVCAGQAISVLVGHDPLETEEPAEAHVAIRVGSHNVFERHVSIPADADVFGETAVAAEDVAAGALVWLHLHNHGDNVWNFYEVKASP